MLRGGGRLVRAAGGDEARQGGDAAEMLAGLRGVGRHRHAITLLQRHAELQRVDRIQPQAFNEQRLLRGRAALGHFGVDLGEGEEAHSWLTSYARLQPSYVRAFEDVLPLLDALDDAGIPYGAVSNNVHDYQRAKLDSAGLERIRRLVGTDTVGVPKPDPAIYLEGVRLLGSSPDSTLYIGDNLLLDAEGSTAAGLVGVWLNRTGESAPDYKGHEVGTLLELLG